MGINVLSLFDGMSCGQIALERAGIKVDNYFASEIDTFAMKITNKNFPNTIQLGDVNGWKSWDLPNIDLILAGSPCQGFSFAGKGLNFADTRSKLFFVFRDILEELKPTKFLLENVKMSAKSEQVISNALGVSPVEINSSLVSAQNRSRLYWSNYPIEKPADSKIYIDSVLSSGVAVAARRGRYVTGNSGPTKQYIEFRNDGKSNCLTTVSKDNVVVNEILSSKVLDTEIEWRYLTSSEYEMLQTVPLGYTEGVSEHQRKRMLGNGWTVDVIAHILQEMYK